MCQSLLNYINVQRTDKGSNTFALIIEMGIRLVTISQRNARNVEGKNVGGREY